MSNDMSMTIHTSKWTGAIEFLHGGCPCFETASSFISAVDWDISSKFGMLIDFHLLKQTPSPNLYPEVHFRLYGRHLEKSISLMFDYYEIWRADAKWHAMSTYGQYGNMETEVEFQNGVRPFPKPEVVINLPWTEILYFTFFIFV